MIRGEIPCLFREITGMYCPGCGGTRALKALMCGDLISSMFYHPLIVFCVVSGIILVGSRLIYIKTKNPKFRLYLDNRYVYMGIGILVINFLIKNYYLLIKGVDLMSMLPAY